MKRIAIFTSGHSRGSNFIAIYDYLQQNNLPIVISYIVVTDETAPIVAHAKKRGINVHTINTKINSVRTNNHPPLQDALIEISTTHPTELIVLCGFMRKLGKTFFEKIKTPVINIHPALLPKYGGKGMYGINVHKAVWEAGEKYSGATVHYVNEHYDGGDIIHQERCDISKCKNPEEIASKVLEIEHKIYPMLITKLV